MTQFKATPVDTSSGRSRPVSTSRTDPTVGVGASGKKTVAPAAPPSARNPISSTPGEISTRTGRNCEESTFPMPVVSVLTRE